jgi:hypothetical protein
MATNLVSEIADFLYTSLVSRIASALGLLNQTSTQKAVVAAVPLCSLLSSRLFPNRKPQPS